MKIKHLWIFIGLVALQILVLLGLFAQRYQTLVSGREVVLLTHQVDPRDMLRGDYIDLHYDAGTIPSYLIENGPFAVGDTVYVLLDGDRSMSVSGVRKSRPTDYQAFLRGKVTSINTDGGISVEYGIEHFYIPAGTGSQYANKMLDVTVRINDSGDAVIENVEEARPKEEAGDMKLLNR